MTDLLAPLAQDPAYHTFADPAGSFWSNAAFLAVGVAGLLRWREITAARRLAYLGCLLVAFGSAWYHAAPSDASLLWDRLPMAVVFAAVFTEALGSFGAPACRRWLWPLTGVAVAGVLWWHWTGDLRPYALVQFGPMLAVPILLCRRRVYAASWWGLLGFYVLAKLLEFADVPIFELTHRMVSGHTLKHVAAAAALWVWRDRSPLG